MAGAYAERCVISCTGFAAAVGAGAVVVERSSSPSDGAWAGVRVEGMAGTGCEVVCEAGVVAEAAGADREDRFATTAIRHCSRIATWL